MNKYEKHNYMNNLFETYGTLLTPKQQSILSYYYNEDYSLSEIAENLKITRSAVLDHIKRSEKILENYEKNLKIVKHAVKRREIYDKIKKCGDLEITHWIEILETFDI